MRLPARRSIALLLAALTSACATAGGGSSAFRGSFNPSARGAADLSRHAPGAVAGGRPIPGMSPPRKPNMLDQGGEICRDALFAGDTPAPALVDTTVRVRLPQAEVQRAAAITTCVVATLSLYGLLLSAGP